MRRWATLAMAAALAAGLSCKAKGGNTTSPERLRDAHVAALSADDPRAAYGLLSPEAQARTSFEEFEKRWRANAADREATLKAAQSLPPDQRGAAMAGTTVHPGGKVVEWTEVGGRYMVRSGLPGRPQTATPAQAIRSFIDAVRRADLSEVRALMTDELAGAVDEDWEARVDAIESALEEPGALDVSSDLQRAVLRYEPQRTLTLQQTPQGWRIMSLQ